VKMRVLSVWSKCQWVSMTYLTGALPRPSRASFELGPGGRKRKCPPTNLPSGPFEDYHGSAGAVEHSDIVQQAFAFPMGTALNLARILASRSAAEGDCCASPAAEARSSVPRERGAPGEQRGLNLATFSRREVCSCKELNFMFFRPSFRSGLAITCMRPRFSSRRVVHERRQLAPTFALPLAHSFANALIHPPSPRVYKHRVNTRFDGNVQPSG